MRQAHFSSEFEPEPPKALKRFILGMVCLFAAACGGVAGFEYRSYLQRQHEANKPLKARPVVQNPPPQILPCENVRDYAYEWDRTCRARMRSGKVGR